VPNIPQFPFFPLCLCLLSRSQHHCPLSCLSLFPKRRPRSTCSRSTRRSTQPNLPVSSFSAMLRAAREHSASTVALHPSVSAHERLVLMRSGGGTGVKCFWKLGAVIRERPPASSTTRIPVAATQAQRTKRTTIKTLFCSRGRRCLFCVWFRTSQLNERLGIIN
jgi:hypothetical protein